jgi:hypothetical protein
VGEARLALSWDPNPEEEQVEAYPIFSGPDKSAIAELERAGGDVMQRSWDAATLGLRYGERICFRLKAMNRCTAETGEAHDCYSAFSDAACATLEQPQPDTPAPGAPNRLELKVTLTVGEP